MKFIYKPVYTSERQPDKEMMYHVFCNVDTGDENDDLIFPAFRDVALFKNGNWHTENQQSKVYCWLDAIEVDDEAFNSIVGAKITILPFS